MKSLFHIYGGFASRMKEEHGTHAETGLPEAPVAEEPQMPQIASLRQCAWISACLAIHTGDLI